MAVQISGNDITVPRDGSFTRNVTIGGTLTYEDVTNIDSVGLVTARTGIEIGARPGVAASISVDGNMIVSGISTFGGDVQVPDKIIHSGDTNTAIRFPAADTITAETGGSERLRIDSNGDIGVNVTTINRSDAGRNTIQFDYSGSDGSEGLEIRLSNSALNGNAATDNAAITYIGQNLGISNRENGNITFYNNGSERARIDSSGRVMIGSATYIGGAALAVLGTSSTPNAYGSLAIGKVGANPTSGTTLANIRLNGGSVGTGRGAEINAIADANWSDGSSHPTYLTFSTVASSSTSATERIRVHAGGNVDIKTGNLVISTAGKGIDFSATSDASGASSELLDDYEEGTFTPSLLQGYSSLSYHYQNGFYTKIGNHVTFSIYIYVYQATGDNAAVRISLPFTSSSDTRRETGAYATYDNATFSSSWNEKSGCCYLIGSNDNYIRPIKRTNGAEIYGNDTELGTGGNNRYFHLVGQMFV